MKQAINFILFFLLTHSVLGQRIVEHQGISATNIDVSDEVVVAEITINPTETGKVVVHFDGTCISTPGDRIILAASNVPDWGVNDGHTSVEAADGDVNRNSFSHTRVYDANPGNQTFYAVVKQSNIENAGDGTASIYASLTVDFIPNRISFVEHQGISVTNIDVSDVEVVGQITINPAETGKVIVHFDGTCISTPGDGIILAASNVPDWAVNDGHTSVETVDSDVNRNSFSHTRVYDVNPGSQTFYAVARQSVVDNTGDGTASIYGSLTVEFIRNSISFVEHQGISETNIVVSDEVVVGEITVNPTEIGKITVHFDGTCISTSGDRIILAAANVPDWGVNDGHTSVEAFDNDINRNSFSHTRVYDANPGNQTFYAVVKQSNVETAGDGIVSIYGSLTVKFSSEIVSDANDLGEAAPIHLFPNPTEGVVHISNFEEFILANCYLKITDNLGRTLQIIEAPNLVSEIDYLSNCPNGIYYFQFIDSKNVVLSNHRVIKAH